MSETNRKHEEMDANITKEEKEMLENDGDTRHVTTDNIDDDGTPLNEQNERSGKDLDVPGSELDDDNESIGEEDEENNLYSGTDNND